MPKVFTHKQTAELRLSLAEDDFYVLKAHGTIDDFDSIIITSSDFRGVTGRHPLAEHLRVLLQTKTLLFIGYSLRDPDLQLILDILVSIYGSYSKSHFALLEQTSACSIRARRFEKDYGIEVISYAASDTSHPEVEGFLRELKQAWESRRRLVSGGRIGNQQFSDAQSWEMLGQFRGRYRSVVDDINDWRLADADQALETLIEELIQAKDAPGASVEMQDLWQRLSIDLANIAAWRGEFERAVTIWENVRNSGELSPERVSQAIGFLANVGDLTGIDELLRVTDESLPNRERLLALTAGMRGDYAPAASIDDDTTDTDLLRLKCRSMFEDLSEDRVLALEALISRAWDAEQPHSPTQVDVAQMTEQLLLRVVEEEWEAAGLDRRRLVRTIRDRFRICVEACMQRKDQFPEAFDRAVLATVAHHRRMGDNELADEYKAMMVNGAVEG